MQTDPASGLPFLQPAYVAQAARDVFLTDDMIRALVAFAPRAAQDETLLAFFWYCRHRILTDATLVDSWEAPWPPLDDYLGAAARLLNVLVMLATVPEMLDVYRRLGIPADLYRDSFRRALEAFPRYYPDFHFRGFWTSTWMMDPRLQELLAPESNIVRLQRELYVYPGLQGDNNQYYERIFGWGTKDINQVEWKTSLQRTIGTYLNSGGHFHGGYCFLLKGSFNLCSGKFGLSAEQSGWKEFIRADEVAALYQGHEVCSHTVNHPRVWSVPVDQLRWEILEDRRRLEALVGYLVRGFVIPYSWATGYGWSMEFLRNCGFKYMRHTVNIPEFEHPADFMDWHPTAHCSADLPKLWASMLQRSSDQPGQLFYLWGHSYEFEDDWGWEVIESFARLASETEGVYHATKGEIYDYVTAWRAMDWSLDGTLVRNNIDFLPGVLRHANERSRWSCLICLGDRLLAEFPVVR